MTDVAVPAAAATPAAAAAVPTDTGHGADAHPPTTTGLSHNKLAMWLFLGSECLLFGALISTYMFAKSRLPAGELGPLDVFDIPFTSVSSFVLLTSSLTMVLALSALKRHEERSFRVWIVATALLGGTFIAGQVYEFTVFYNHGLGYTTNIFGSAFYTLTGFHGAHVTIGIVMLMSLLVTSLRRGGIGADNAETVELIGLYWHFVDIVWILIFTIIYLFPQ